MKDGVYTVKGTLGPYKTEPVSVVVSYGTRPEGTGWFASFDHEGQSFVFRPRPLSPHPERLEPARVLIGIQPTARSIASEAFKAAKKAAEEDAHEADLTARDAAQEGMSLDDITMGGVLDRNMGVPQ